MKITKNQLRRIIKEERQKLLKEQYGSQIETGSNLIEFASAYASLGSSVQEQVDQIVSAYNSGGESQQFREAVYEVNPNALNMVMDRLGRVLGLMNDDDAVTIQEALYAAMEIFNEGDAEVETDARAAGDR